MENRKRDSKPQTVSTNWYRNIKYRWQHNCAPLPGELEPIDSPGGKITIVGSWCDGDAEKNMLLRKFRGLLGYGQGWTFLGAVGEILLGLVPWILIALSICMIVATVLIVF